MTSITSYALPLQTVIPSYAYEQYWDDVNVAAFVSSYNGIAAQYLEWFNSTPLGVYTGLSGLLLDWCAVGIYGLQRPTLATFSMSRISGYNSIAYNSIAYNAERVKTSGTAQTVSDDIYQRVLTWWLYRGDGNIMTLSWLKRRVSRFLYGPNGTDISYPPASPPSVKSNGAVSIFSFKAAYNVQPYNTKAYGGGGRYSSGQIIITVPNNALGKTLQSLVAEGLLALPFQYPVTVVL